MFEIILFGIQLASNNFQILEIISVSLLVIELLSEQHDPDQTARMRRLVWIHAGRKPIMFVLS
jgi:hypothetical protein